MGSPLRFVVVGATPVLAERAWTAVDAEFEAAEQAMSRYRETSDITRANRAAGRERAGAGWTEVDARLRHALATAHRASRLTGGMFDARVLADLERLGSVGVRQTGGAARDDGSARDDGRARDDGPAGRREARPAADRDARWLELDGRWSRVRVAVPVDLGGIGKGLALRWAWRRARRVLGPAVGAMIEAGGDIVVGGPAPDAGGWSVGIEDPFREGEHLAVIGVAAGAVATSSVAVNRWTAPDGRLVHHLIDPATGEPGGPGLLAVTVAAGDPAWAEVWSKTLFLAGRAGVGPMARARGLAAWWVTFDGTLEMTPAARVLTTWEPEPEKAATAGG